MEHSINNFKETVVNWVIGIKEWSLSLTLCYRNEELSYID